jgi:hypothetical protein
MTAIPRDAHKFTVTFQRDSVNRLNDASVNNALDYICQAAQRNKTYNFKAGVPKGKVVTIKLESGYRTVALIRVWREIGNAGTAREYFDETKRVMVAAANGKNWQFVDEGNHLPTINDEISPEPKPTTEVPKSPKKIVSSVNLELPPLTNEILKQHFWRLFARGPHIRIIYDSMNMAVKTKFQHRNHILLRGLAGCAKTELFHCFRKFIGENNVLHLDATTLSKAGLEKTLVKMSDDGSLPPVVLLEEIEKVMNPQNLNCLLQMMDDRGAVQRTNARDGNVYAECRSIVWATCNDSKLLKSFADGAIWSRFSLRPVCKRPNPPLMAKILNRIVTETNGNPQWVPPIIDFLWNKLKTIPEYKVDYNDPRLGKALLAGGDRLFDKGPTGFFNDFLKVCNTREAGDSEEDESEEDDEMVD